MKKKSDQPFPSITLSDNTGFPTKLNNKEKQFKRPDPPSEETVLRLNAIVKEAPFCFYFQGRENDFL